jgi:ParB family transcriptional regulator, chromosome partitioning protein
MLEMALVENIQRENLNAIEVGLSYKRLIEECSLTQEELSKRVGKERSTITNYMRLLKLPAQIQAAIRDGKISMGHARALLGLEGDEKQVQVFNRIVNDNLSVRDVENISRNVTAFKSTRSKSAAAGKEFLQVEADLRAHLQTAVSIKADKNGKGKIVISFKSAADFARIINTIKP